MAEKRLLSTFQARVGEKVNQKYYTTPRAHNTAQLLGARNFNSIALTNDELNALQKLYGFNPEPPNVKPPPPVAPVRESFDSKWKYEDALFQHERAVKRHDGWEDPRALLQAGADRNTIRHAEADGLRIVAWLAKYIPTGEDPLKHVVQFATECGLDVDPEDVEWANDDEQKDDNESLV